LWPERTCLEWPAWPGGYSLIQAADFLRIRLRSEIHRLQLDRDIKGDALKENTRMALENAIAIVVVSILTMTLDEVDDDVRAANA
jgi:hypothetical protein